MALPTCVALRSKHDNSYLRSVHDESRGGSLVELGHGDDAGIMNPRCRFYLEPSKEHEGLMHVRCCYNNKYWVPQQRVLHDGGRARWMIGTADEPDEDLSKPSCTLVKHIPIDDGSTCRFQHSKLGKYACVSSTPFTPIRSYMHIASQEGTDGQGGRLIDAFTLIDVSSQKQLPSYVAFKGDNNCFLAAAFFENNRFLQFYGEDIGDPLMWHVTFTNADGVVRIKSKYTDLFWRNGGNWIFADSDDTTHNNRDTLFRVTTGDDFIALQNLGNNNFCKRLTTEGKTSCLNASANSITIFARLQCYEPVLSRDIYDVDFRLSEARVYTQGIDDLDSLVAKNKTTETSKATLAVTYTYTVASTWSSTVSMKLGVKTNIKCMVPFLVEGKIELSAEFSGSFTWGKIQTETTQKTKSITVDVPPKKKVTTKAIGSNGFCDIPFSYKQRDVLFNGQEVIQEFTDGMYFGVKTSNVTFEVEEEDL